MHKAMLWIGGVLTFLAILAAWSRIATMKGIPDTIKNGANALGRVFNGAFGY